MIGTSLPLGVLTQNPACEADKRLLDDYGGIRALLAAFREMGVGAVELRSVKAHADAETLAACARAVLDAGLSMTIQEMEEMGNPVHHLTRDARDYLLKRGIR